MHNRNYHILFRFPSVGSEPVNVEMLPTEKGNPDRVGARASLSSSLGGNWGGRRASGRCHRALTQEGAHPGDKGGRWRIRSKEPD